MSTRNALGVPTVMDSHHLLHSLILFHSLFHPDTLTLSVSQFLIYSTLLPFVSTFLSLFLFDPSLSGSTLMSWPARRCLSLCWQHGKGTESSYYSNSPCWQLRNYAAWWKFKFHKQFPPGTAVYSAKGFTSKGAIYAIPVSNQKKRSLWLPSSHIPVQYPLLRDTCWYFKITFMF